MEGNRQQATGKKKERSGPPAAVLSFSFVLLPLCFLPGCQSCELVEAELRAREHQLREARDDLHRSECLNEALVRELQTLKQSTASHSVSRNANAAAPAVLKEVVLGRQTGGYDEDGTPGDEAIQVVLEPRDLDGRAVRAAGAVQVSVLEIGPQGTKTALSTWDVSAEQLRPSWRNGLLSTGYFLVLPWKTWPTSKKLRVMARFTLEDGAVFEADKDVTIRLGKAGTRKPPAEVEPGPPPRKVEPTTAPQAHGRRTAWGDFFDLAAHWQKPQAKSPRAAQILPPVPATP
jgi:hypothetical protein